MRFTGEVKNHREINIYKYPGGEIPLFGSYEQIMERFKRKGFSEEATQEILFSLWGGVPAETAISLAEVVDGIFEESGGKVGK